MPTITALKQKSSFRRSSERDLAAIQAKVEEERLRKRDDEKQKLDAAFERGSYGIGECNTGLVRLATMDEVFGDPKLYDECGLVP
jgi:hypothetical protein